MQTASEIPGLVPEKNQVGPIPDNILATCDHEYDIGYNQAIDLISPKRLKVVICREKLAKNIYESDMGKKHWPTWENCNNKESYFKNADAIILAAKQDKDLVKIVCTEE